MKTKNSSLKAHQKAGKKLNLENLPIDQEKMASVFDYTNYRRFLKARFLAQKGRNPAFSYRAFNRLAGIKSSGFLKLVVDGKRNLADDGIRMIAQGFKLNEEERKYFEVLVKFNQAKGHEEKDYYFKQLSKNKKFLAAKPLTAAQYRLFSHWYYVAILELVRIKTSELKDVRWIQKKVNPKVPLKDLKKAVEELKKLKLLVERKNQGLIRKEGMLATEDEVQSLAVANYHQQMSKLAARAVIKEPAQEREFSSLTIVTSKESFKKAKQEIQKFRKKLHSILEQENRQPKSFVAHLNFQLFQLSKGE